MTLQRHRTSIRIAPLRVWILGMTFVLGMGAARGEDRPTVKSNKEAIEQIVERYILEHPQVLIDSVRRYQEQQRAAQQQKSKENVAANASALFHDAASPVVEPPAGP